jgi:hypothetical protein
MDKIYNSNKLVQIIYGEAPFSDYFGLDDAMQADPAIRTEFRHIYDMVNSLPEVKINPSQLVINNLLSISKR